jgi:hypothetical protein
MHRRTHLRLREHAEAAERDLKRGWHEGARKVVMALYRVAYALAVSRRPGPSRDACLILRDGNEQALAFIYFSTMQTLVTLTDTSSPAKWSMLHFSF